MIKLTFYSLGNFIEQERRALLFCKEDRAILCRECDLPIHQANEHTQKHNRFLLTGVKLSASSSSSSSSLNPSSSCSNRSAATMGAEFNNFQSPMKRAQSTSSPCELFSSPSMAVAATNYTVHDYNKVMSDGGSIPTSSISEYLMETLPGWRVEDLLDPSAAFNCFSKVCSNPYINNFLWNEIITVYIYTCMASMIFNEKEVNTYIRVRLFSNLIHTGLSCTYNVRKPVSHFQRRKESRRVFRF